VDPTTSKDTIKRAKTGQDDLRDEMLKAKASISEMKDVNELKKLALINSAVTYDDDKVHTTHSLDVEPILPSSFSQDSSEKW